MTQKSQMALMNIPVHSTAGLVRSTSCRWNAMASNSIFLSKAEHQKGSTPNGSAWNLKPWRSLLNIPSPRRRVARLTCQSAWQRRYVSLFYGLDGRVSPQFAGLSEIGGDGVCTFRRLSETSGVCIKTRGARERDVCIACSEDTALEDASAILAMGMYAVYPGIHSYYCHQSVRQVSPGSRGTRRTR